MRDSSERPPIDPRRVAWGRIVQAFIRAGWNPPPPDDRVVSRLADTLTRRYRLELAHRPTAGADTGPLTVRQCEILALAALGSTNEEIAFELDLTVETVKHHLKRILPRLGARNRTHAVALAVDRGFVVLEP